jgi:hypothetical protein
MSRRPFHPTDEQRVIVEAAIACGIEHEIIVRSIINPENGRPIDRKGTHDASNIALAHKGCNSSKQARRTHLI